MTPAPIPELGPRPIAMTTAAFAQVAPHIHRLEVPFRVAVNVWLVGGDGGWAVVDAGAPSFEGMVLEAVLRHTDGQHPRCLILTHGHLDHAAAAQRMRDEWGLPIAAGRAEIPYLTGPDRYHRIPADGPLYRLLQQSPPPLIGRNVQLPLDEGMRIAGMEVFHAPGHAPGMVALLHAGDRALICADAFMNRGMLGDPFGAFTYDRALNRRSQARLAALEFDHLLVSHGPPLMSGAAQVREFVAGRQRRRK